MTKRDPKDKLQIPTRAPRAKGGMFENLRTPDQIESIPFEELVAPAEGQGVRPPLTPSSGQTPIGGQTVAPAKDFNRRANSLDRDALPAGYFPGTSKKLYDALYLRTIGAVAPRRTVFATKRDLAKWSGIKNRKTLDAHMRFFDLCGLVKRQWQPGQNEGYSFEVFLPEEIGLGVRPPLLDRPPEGTDQISDRGSDQKSGSGGQTQIFDFQGASESSKTSLIQAERKLDDEAAPGPVLENGTAEIAAFAGLFEALSTATLEITGKSPGPVDRDRWRELADLLVTELKIAAGRTTVSSVPAFLAEHLRRRLWKLDKARQDASGGAVEARERASGDGPEHKIDASGCPDCFGAGMFYPDGFDKGVARCQHLKLSKTSEGKP